ncbi:MAG: class I SAM-dependent RNA methyltransferase [Bdellovibrionia bacterium]
MGKKPFKEFSLRHDQLGSNSPVKTHVVLTVPVGRGSAWCFDGAGRQGGGEEMNPQELRLKITDLSRGGAGLARDESGRVVFVPFTAPGDVVRVQLTSEDRRYAEAQVVEILEPSELRQEPVCPAFGRCGGCQWQHLPYSYQWETKVKGVAHALKRVNLELPSNLELAPAEQIWNYRNRIQLRGKAQSLGFYQARSQTLVAVEGCPIARPELNAQWEQVRKQGSQLRRPFKVELEVLPSGEVRSTWNSRHSAGGFRQVHDAQNEKLKAWIQKVIPESDILYDLYGGSGNLSLPLVDRCSRIHCVDLGAPRQKPEGVADHFEFHRSAVDTWLAAQRFESPSPLRSSSSPQISAIIDPPRDGLRGEFQEVAQAMDRMQVNQIVAIGCDPDSWARDLSGWVKKGWTLQRVFLVDLFPQTYHIESVGLLVSCREF